MRAVPVGGWVVGAWWVVGSLVGLVYVSQGTLSVVFERPYVWGTTFFYREQLASMLQGGFGVGTGLLGECHVREGVCYGYFGPTPSVLRLPLWVVGFPGSGSVVLGWVAVVVGLALGLALVGVVWRLTGAPGWRGGGGVLWLVVACGVVAGASPLLIDLTRSAAGEAIAWGVVFTLAGVGCVVGWWWSQRWWWVVGAVVAVVCGASARPGVALVGVVLGVAVVVAAYGARRGGGGGRWWVAWVGAVGCAVLPVVGVVGVFWLKFGQLVPDWRLHEAYSQPVFALALEANGGQLAGLRFLPTLLAFYLRPWGLGVTEAFPWVTWQGEVVLLWPLAPGSIVNQGGLSLTATYPLVVVLVVVLVVRLLARPLGVAVGGVRGVVDRVLTEPATMWVLLVMAGAAPAMTTLMFHGLTPRYLADWGPFIVLVTALGCASLARSGPWRGRGARLWSGGALAVGMVLAVWSVVVVNAYAVRLAAPLLLPWSVVSRVEPLVAAGVVCPAPGAVTQGTVALVSESCAVTVASFADPVTADVLAGSGSQRVREAVAEHADAGLLRRLAGDPSAQVRVVVARRGTTPRDVLTDLSVDPSAQVRLAVAGNPDAPREVLRQLTADPDPSVSGAAAQNPRL